MSEETKTLEAPPASETRTTVKEESLAEKPEVSPVDPSSLKDKDLDTLLSDRMSKESGKSEKEEDDTAEEEETEMATEPAAKADGKKAPEVAKTPYEANTLRDDMEKLRKQVEDKEAMIQRQANELGELRKIKKAKQKEEFGEESEQKQSTVDRLLENPEEAIEDILERRDAKRSYEALRMEQSRKQVKDFVLSKVPNFQDLTEDMAKIALEDGNTEEHIKAFNENPWDTNPGILIGLAQRAKLQREIAELKKKPGEVLQKIAKVSKEAGRSITAKSGQAQPKNRVVSEVQVASMSNQEIDDHLANNKE